MPDYLLPDVGEGLTEAEIVSWRVEVGDTVAVNDIVCEIETAKSIVELPSPYAGRVTGVLAAVGETVAVGTPIISIGAAETASSPAPPPPPMTIDMSNPAASGSGEGESLVGRMKADRGPTRRPRKVASGAVATHLQAQAAFEPGAAAPLVEAEEPEPEVPPSRPAEPLSPARLRVLAKPPVRKLARDFGVDLATVTPTGPNGTITRADVTGPYASTLTLDFDDGSPSIVRHGTSTQGLQGRQGLQGVQDGQGARETRETRETREPIKGVRKTMGAAMVQSAFSAPHVTEWVTLDVTRTVELVDRLRARREFRDVKVSPLLVLARAVLLAMRRTPVVNSTWDDTAHEVVTKHYVNLGIAAATPRGLVVPNVKDAEGLSLLDLATALGELTSVAREGRTQPRDMADGTFTITNVGVFGIDSGTPIINPGESAILAFGAIRKQPWVVTEDGVDTIAIRQVTTLALSFDHRHIDGEAGSRYLADVAGILVDPATALLF